MKNKYDVFISYRRSGGFESASLIAEKLRGMGYSVFFDVESLRSGKFNDQLYRVIEQCKDFVVVLPEKALDRCTKEDGSANEDDWIRKEVIHAMARDKNVVPVMLAGFEWPTKMPEGIESLKDYQSITATGHETFDLAMLRLAGYLKSNPHKHKLLKMLAVIVFALIAISAIGYFALLQVAKNVCTSVANEYSIAMEQVHELRCDEDELKTEWEGFLNSYRTALTSERLANVESDMIDILNRKETEGEELRKRIRPALVLSDWQTFLLGLYNSQKEDVESLPLFVDSYVVDLDSVISVIRRSICTHSYKPSDIRNVKLHLEFYEHSVNMMYYSYLQELAKLPQSSYKSHNELSRGWNLLPTTSLALPQEEYERLVQQEVTKMEELMHKMEAATTIKENETYEMEQRLDTLEAIANALTGNSGMEVVGQPSSNVAEERVSLKRELVEQKRAELAEETQKVLNVYEELKMNCKLKSSDSDGYQWGKVIRMARMLSKSVAENRAALQQGIESGSIIKPSVVYADLCTMLSDYTSFHPEAKTYITTMREYYKSIADGKYKLGGQLIFAFKDNARHPLYRVGDIIVKRNDQPITDYASLSAAVSKDKCGTVEFLRMEGSRLVLHKENVPESSVLVGYMEVGEY